MPGVEVKRQLSAADIEAATRMLTAAAGAEGADGADDKSVPPVAAVAWDGSQPEPVGLARVGPDRSGWRLEVVTDPASPSPGAVWHSLVTAGLEVVGNQGGGRVQLWARQAGAEHDELARRAGLRPWRDLYQMRRPLPVEEPLTLATRPFVVGQDEAAWLAVNNRAFAGHPDQGGWDVREVRLREQEPWFDPAGFFLAERVVDGSPRLVGFHWTKVHGADRDAHGHPPIGEVYIVGVDPSEQGRGLGPALTLTGLHSLRDRGLSDVLLYVDESNVAAVRVYERLGFTRHATDVMYRRG